MNTKEDSAAELLRAHGLRATAPRIAIVQLLQTHTDPLSVLEIADSLKRRIDVVTAYRTVETLTSAGALREVNLQGEKARFEIADEHDHHHLVCTNCHRIEDFTGCDVQKLEKTALKQAKSFAKVTGHSFDLYGVCNECAK